jgi:hypothetical protein
MHTFEAKANLNKPRLTAVRRAMTKLNKSRYQILKLVGAGKLEAEEVDDHLAIVTDSIERYQAANPDAA